MKYNFLMWINKVTKRKELTAFRGSVISRSSQFEGQNYVYSKSYIRGCKFGYATYVAENSQLVNVKIGRYTSIGSRVLTISGNHPTAHVVSTHPAFYSLRKQSGFTYVSKQKFQENKQVNETDAIVIGNDVWIGNDVRIMEGITIGDGAIIATGAIVVKDVPPYAIIGGVPAKIIRFRFTDEEIKFLLELQWWDKDVEWIKSYAEMFEDISKLQKSLGEAK